MNERQFLKAINQKGHITCGLTYVAVYNLLENSKKVSVDKKTNIFKRLFLFNKKQKSIKQIIEDNFEYILNNESNDYIGTLLVELLKNAETKGVVIEKFESVLKRFSDITKIDRGRIYILGTEQESFFEELRKNTEGEELIRNNFEHILDSILDSNLFEIAQGLKGISEETDNILNQYMEKKHKEISYSLIDTYKIKNIENGKNPASNYTDTISIIIKELLESEQVRIVDMVHLGGGSYSDVYQIGNKVLKIGRLRETYNIPNHQRILQPLTRINLLDENDNPVACIEIADRVDKLKKEDIDIEKLYQLYKELRDDGIIWTDARYDNVGILNNPNIPNLNGNYMNVAPHSVGFIDDIKGKETTKGDMVVLDTDYIYSQDSNEIRWQDIGYAKEFEKRWQQEQQAGIAAKYQNNEVEASKNERRQESEK